MRARVGVVLFFVFVFIACMFCACVRACVCMHVRVRACACVCCFRLFAWFCVWFERCFRTDPSTGNFVAVPVIVPVAM